MSDSTPASRRPHVLVLESVWEDDLSDTTSVRPFLEGWARAVGARVAFRSFHDARDLGVWLEELFSHPTHPSLCYIAGHGEGGRLTGAVGEDINLVSLLRKVHPPGRRRGRAEKGILLGACEAGSPRRRRALLEATGPGLAWVAGYEREVPWLEATLCDLLFLTYWFEGRCQRVPVPPPRRARPAPEEAPPGWQPPRRLEFACDEHDEFVTRGTRSAERLARWVREDMELAAAAGFGATDRGRGRRRRRPAGR